MDIQSFSALAEGGLATAAGDREHHRQILNELVDLGAELARLVVSEAKARAEAAGANAASAPEAVVALDRIARAIRRTVNLSERLSEPARVHAESSAARHRTAARRRIIRDVEDVIQREACGSEAESLRGEMLERLDGPDLEDDIDDRPVADIVADICRDLGLAAVPGTRPWQRRTPDDIAELCAVAARPRATGMAGVPPAGASRRAVVMPCEGEHRGPPRGQAGEAGEYGGRVGVADDG